MEIIVRYKKAIFGLVITAGVVLGYEQCPKTFKDFRQGAEFELDVDREQPDAGK